VGLFDLCVGRADPATKKLWQSFQSQIWGFRGHFSTGLGVDLRFCASSISPFHIGDHATV
jgi:hypothetical protein